MKIEVPQTSKTLQQYLLRQGYHAIYWKYDSRGFYNLRNRQTLLVPDENCTISNAQILALFQNSQATDLPLQLEWYQLLLFLNVTIKN